MSGWVQFGEGGGRGWYEWEGEWMARLCWEDQVKGVNHGAGRVDWNSEREVGEKKETKEWDVRVGRECCKWERRVSVGTQGWVRWVREIVEQKKEENGAIIWWVKWARLLDERVEEGIGKGASESVEWEVLR